MVLPCLQMRQHRCLPAVVRWRGWPRGHIRREWLKVIRREPVVFTFEATPAPLPITPVAEEILSRARRAHWRLSGEHRFAHNARSADSTSFSVTLPPLPATL